MASPETLQRFLAFAQPQPGGCWLWGGHCNRDGYGTFSIDGQSEYAHRVSYTLFVGEIPDGYVVCHSCDIPGCVAPSHLWIGTERDNAHDRDAKGRGPVGCRNGRAKLDWTIVRQIRREFQAGRLTSLAAAGRQYGVSARTIRYIIDGQHWPEPYSIAAAIPWPLPLPLFQEDYRA